LIISLELRKKYQPDLARKNLIPDFHDSGGGFLGQEIVATCKQTDVCGRNHTEPALRAARETTVTHIPWKYGFAISDTIPPTEERVEVI
jgi:hypothetical protein